MWKLGSETSVCCLPKKKKTHADIFKASLLWGRLLKTCHIWMLKKNWVEADENSREFIVRMVFWPQSLPVYPNSSFLSHSLRIFCLSHGMLASINFQGLAQVNFLVDYIVRKTADECHWRDVASYSFQVSSWISLCILGIWRDLKSIARCFDQEVK